MLLKSLNDWYRGLKQIFPPYLVLFVFSLRHPYKFEKSKYCSILIWIVALVSSVFILENAINERLVCKGTPQIVKVAISFVNQINLYKEAMKRTEPRELDAKLTHNAGSQTCVLIIGESCSRRHLSLYGAICWRSWAGPFIVGRLPRHSNPQTLLSMPRNEVVARPYHPLM